MDHEATAVQAVLVTLASSQHGVVTRAQLLHAGVTPQEIRDRVRSGALLREHRGVYRVGHRAPSLEARYMAAVLACGDEACLSGRAAAHLLGLLKGHPPPPEVSTGVKRRVCGVKVRRARLDRADRMVNRGIPGHDCSTHTHRPRRGPLRRCPCPCLPRGRRPLRHLAAALTRRPPNLPGALLRRHGLPLPRTNRPAGAHHVDCRWPDRQLTVELDSYRFHHSRHAWEQDRRRDREARARGDDVRRYTWADVFAEPQTTIAELRGLLSTDAPAPPRGENLSPHDYPEPRTCGCS